MSEINSIEIGKGSYGKVYKLDMNGRKVALKKSFEEVDSSVLISFTREILIMSLLSHPNILNCLDFKIRKGGLELYTPWHPYCLKDFIQNYNYSGILCVPNHIICNFLLDILEGLNFLHYNNIIHGDISEDNILISSNYKCLIADFGLSQLEYSEQEKIINEEGLNSKASLMEEVFKNPYSSPEVLEGNKCYNSSSDIWAFGVLIMRFFSNKYFFGNESCRKQQLKNVNLYLDLSNDMKNVYMNRFINPKTIDMDGIFFSDEISYTYIEIINEIFIRSINNRPTAKMLIKKIDHFESIFKRINSYSSLNSETSFCSHKKPLLFDFIRNRKGGTKMSSTEYTRLVKEALNVR